MMSFDEIQAAGLVWTIQIPNLAGSDKQEVELPADLL
jgi:hypothetical protein